MSKTLSVLLAVSVIALALTAFSPSPVSASTGTPASLSSLVTESPPGLESLLPASGTLDWHWLWWGGGWPWWGGGWPTWGATWPWWAGWPISAISAATGGTWPWWGGGWWGGGWPWWGATWP
jgi:hypothetical protein